MSRGVIYFQLPIHQSEWCTALTQSAGCALIFWTVRDCAPGELMFAPWTHEIKDRLYTTGLSVSVQGIPRDAVPGNRVLALDGRKRSHLGHGDLVNNVPGAGDNLFWCIQRVHDRQNANMFLEHCSVLDQGMTVNLPDGAKELKSQTWKMPKVPVLINKKDVLANTLLLALEDPIIAKAREEDKGSDEKTAKKAKHE